MSHFIIVVVYCIKVSVCSVWPIFPLHMKFPVIFHSKCPLSSSFLSINTQIPVMRWWWHHNLLSAFHPSTLTSVWLSESGTSAVAKVTTCSGQHATIYKKLARCYFIAGKCKHRDERKGLPCIGLMCLFFSDLISAWKLFWKIFFSSGQTLDKSGGSLK